VAGATAPRVLSFASGGPEQQAADGCRRGDQAAAEWVVRQPNSPLGSGPEVTTRHRPPRMARPRRRARRLQNRRALLLSSRRTRACPDYRADSGGGHQTRAAAHNQLASRQHPVCRDRLVLPDVVAAPPARLKRSHGAVVIKGVDRLPSRADASEHMGDERGVRRNCRCDCRGQRQQTAGDCSREEPSSHRYSFGCDVGCMRPR